MSAKDKLLKRINKLEKLDGNRRFEKFLRRFAHETEGHVLLRSKLVKKAKNVTLERETSFGKDGKIDSTALVLVNGEGSLFLRRVGHKFEIESRLNGVAGRTFGKKLLFTFGLTRKLSGKNEISRKDYDKGVERFVEYYLEKA